MHLPHLTLLPLALAVHLPVHLQQLLDKYGAENVNFDSEVSIFLSCPASLSAS